MSMLPELFDASECDDISPTEFYQILQHTSRVVTSRFSYPKHLEPPALEVSYAITNEPSILQYPDYSDYSDKGVYLHEIWSEP